jgi:hypothetical protein
MGLLNCLVPPKDWEFPVDVVSRAATHKQVSRIFHSRETMGVVTKELSASLATLRLERERELYNTLFQGTSGPWLFFVL